MYFKLYLHSDSVYFLLISFLNPLINYSFLPENKNMKEMKYKKNEKKMIEKKYLPLTNFLFGNWKKKKQKYQISWECNCRRKQ